MMWIIRHHESGNPSHGRSVLDCLRSRQEEFSFVSLESVPGIRWSAWLGFRGIRSRVSLEIIKPESHFFVVVGDIFQQRVDENNNARHCETLLNSCHHAVCQIFLSVQFSVAAADKL